MAYIKCDGCGEIIEIPAELCPDPETIAITEPYYCDACESKSRAYYGEFFEPYDWDIETDEEKEQG